MSEVVDSGPEKSNNTNKFSQTFNLLSQYLKETGSLGDFNLGMATRPPKESSSQLSIFYAGQVIVVDDFPPDKALEIMKLAGSGTPNAVSDLPLARKASLARFLEKRRERITARACAYSKPEPVVDSN
ncbi:protein TIFY 11d-like [Bidens hawaiensis]|uniref:protein TIFY 11d-like n=1 Tax=Bidens hawaiensis TaxID=980011 RepID=UPI00404AD310